MAWGRASGRPAPTRVGMVIVLPHLGGLEQLVDELVEVDPVGFGAGRHRGQGAAEELVDVAGAGLGDQLPVGGAQFDDHRRAALGVHDMARCARRPRRPGRSGRGRAGPGRRSTPRRPRRSRRWRSPRTGRPGRSPAPRPRWSACRPGRHIAGRGHGSPRLRTGCAHSWSCRVDLIWGWIQGLPAEQRALRDARRRHTNCRGLAGSGRGLAGPARWPLLNASHTRGPDVLATILPPALTGQ